MTEQPKKPRRGKRKRTLAEKLDALAKECASLPDFDPRSADGWNNRGWAQLQLGFGSAAISSFERALAIDPGSERARNNLALARKAL